MCVQEPYISHLPFLRLESSDRDKGSGRKRGPEVVHGRVLRPDMDALLFPLMRGKGTVRRLLPPDFRLRQTRFRVRLLYYLTMV